MDIDFTGRFLEFKEEHHGKFVRVPTVVGIGLFLKLNMERNLRQYWSQTARELLFMEKKKERGRAIEIVGGRIAGQEVSLRVSGNVNINGGIRREDRSMVMSTVDESQNTSFKLDQKQQFNIEGKIGKKISVLVDQDSERDFEFENALKIHYTGEEDEIVKRIEAGNIDLSLPSTQFVTFGGRNQGLFGLKSLMKIGGLDITTVASIERGKKEKISLESGATTQGAEIYDYEYRRYTYFFLDEYYRNAFYPLSKGQYRLPPSYRIITDIEVYKSVTVEEAGTFQGKAVIDPNDLSVEENFFEEIIFKKLERNIDYTLEQNFGYIRFNTQVYEGDVIAVAYRDSSGKIVGDLYRSPDDTSQIILKLIKPQSPQPSDPTWNLEFKNVYFLGATNINEEGFEVIIQLYQVDGEPQERDSAGVNYLQIFGLDSVNTNGDPIPDERIDINPNLVNLATGELIFPFLRPFDNERLSEKLRNPTIYDTLHDRLIRASSKFKIIAKYKNRSSTINLGFNIIEGSEEVILNGQPMKKGLDYTIDYFTGTLTLLNSNATDPGANLEIKFEKNEFFQLDKKSLLGTRAEYRFWENSFIGGTFLFYNKSTIEQKVRVGEEPMRNMIWDLNTRLEFKPTFLTKAVDALPLVETDQPSSFSVEGEIAQILPNPNTLSSENTADPDGVAYIDDFESSKQTTSLPVRRRYWTKSSAPLDVNPENRTFMFWYNPFERVRTKEIWPFRETNPNWGNDRTDVLRMVLDTDRDEKDKERVPPPPDSAWGGIMRALSPGYFDQTQTKFLEVWVQGDRGRVNIDLGLMSEDINNNWKLDSEDRPESNFITGNGILEEDEDTGLDGVFSRDEEGYDPASNPDPSGDNWRYTPRGAQYRYINGTEGNRDDEGGRYPDTEDLNRNARLDVENGYFEYSFRLDGTDSHLIAGGQDNTFGWR
ncbi:MAG: cell surface protein SprA, partial [Fidelibacterota bacterium]